MIAGSAVDKEQSGERNNWRKLTGKRVLGFALSSMLVALCAPASAQQPGKVFRIGFLERSNASGIAGLLEAFRQELSKLGWIKEFNP